MTTYVALLYSIVLTPGRRVVMADLKALASELSLRAPRTLFSTGNLVFEAENADTAALEHRLEQGFEGRFGRHVHIIVRTAGEWRRLVAGNPFPEQAALRPDRVIARIGRMPVEPSVMDKLLAGADRGERVAIVDGDLWVAFAGPANESRLLGRLAPKSIGGVGTLRNWNTLGRLADMLDPQDGQ